MSGSSGASHLLKRQDPANKAPIAADKAVQLVALTPAFAGASWAPNRRIGRPIGPAGIRSAEGGNAMSARVRGSF